MDFNYDEFMESEIFGVPRKNGEIIDYEDLYEHLEETNVKQDEKTEQLEHITTAIYGKMRTPNVDWSNLPEDLDETTIEGFDKLPDVDWDVISDELYSTECVEIQKQRKGR